jgi:hypothetical protein
MKLILENSKAVFDVPEEGRIMIGNDEDCQVQINHPEIWGRHAVILANKYGYVLEIESKPISVNGIIIESSCMLYAGDELTIADLSLILVDDEYIPKTVKVSEEFDQSSEQEELSSVFGLRQLNGEDNGAFIKTTYHHPDGWTVYRNEARLALFANNKTVFVNGQQVDSAWLQNGDRIHYMGERFNVECPGHSGYSKFSPSHPRNVMLSEALSESETEDSKKPPLNTHYWWITLVIGLLALIVVILSR